MKVRAVILRSDSAARWYIIDVLREVKQLGAKFSFRQSWEKKKKD